MGTLSFIFDLMLQSNVCVCKYFCCSLTILYTQRKTTSERVLLFLIIFPWLRTAATENPGSYYATDCDYRPDSPRRILFPPFLGTCFAGGGNSASFVSDFPDAGVGSSVQE